jgi:hypothetical protein
MSIIGSNILAGASGQAGGGGAYEIERSVRFSSSDSAYLSRTPASSSNRKTWTWAGWVKRTVKNTATDQMLFTGGTTSSDTGFLALDFNSSDKLRLSSAATNFLITTAVYRDSGAWMHIVLAFDATQGTNANKAELYVNGTEVTVFDTDGRSSISNQDYGVNQAAAHEIGRASLGSNKYLDGYLADVHLIDGQALDPTSFGEFDTNGVWQPKAFSGGSYGTNGFRLSFSDNSTAAALGTDSSGSGNTWTVNNISVTAGAGNDSLVDSPTNGSQTDTGAGGEVVGNYCTWNPLNKGSNLTISNGNLDVSGSTGHATVLTTIPVVAGMKSYMEFTVTTDGAGGWGVTTNPAAENSYGEIAGKWWVYDNGGTFVIINQTSGTGYSPRVNSGDVLQLAIDYSTGKVHVGINNTWINSTNGTDGNPATGANPTFTLSTTAPIFPIFESASLLAAANFGQRAFAYTAPSGFKALCTTNLPEPTIADGSTAMDVALYTGNGSTQTISGLGFSPDFVWYKQRNGSYGHDLYDIVRGTGNILNTNNTLAEYSDANRLTAFNSDGFSLGSSAAANGSGSTYVAWTWDAGSSTVTNTEGSITSQVRANASAGFSVVTYTGNGSSGATIGHGLGVKPALIITKNRDASDNWVVQHTSQGAGKAGYLNTADAFFTSSFWNSTEPTSSVFSVGNQSNVNGSGVKLVAYCFAPVAGYSSFGSYTGNGSADGPFVFTGMRPRWIMIKTTANISGNWYILDTARDSVNVMPLDLYANAAGAESTITTNQLDALSNGFKLRGTGGGMNGSGHTLIYAAFAESPFQYARAR